MSHCYFLPFTRQQTEFCRKSAEMNILGQGFVNQSKRLKAGGSPLELVEPHFLNCSIFHSNSVVALDR